jgi:glucan phosphoethanolaminetransferase (alkaline phosphatase superfamily)
MNFTRLILLACWFGAALFFGAVVAPAAFGVLRSFGLANANEIAGSIVTRSLSVINVAGFLIALLLLLSLLLWRNSAGRISFILECVCLVVIAIGAGVGHWVIAARMRALRAAMVRRSIRLRQTIRGASRLPLCTVIRLMCSGLL